MAPAGRLGLREIGLIGLLALASVLVRLPFLALPMITDEGGYAYVAKFWSHDYQLYRDIPFDRPQGIFVIYRLCLEFFGTGIEAIRLFAALVNAATVVVLTLLGRQALSARAGWIAGALFALFSAAPFIEGFTANAETFMALPIVVSAYLTWRQRWFWAGLAAALAVLLKPSGAAALALAIMWVFATASWSRTGLVLCGFAVGLAPSVGHGVWIGWDHYWQSIHRRIGFYDRATLSLANQWRAITSGLSATLSSWLFPGVAAALSASVVQGPARTFGLLWLVSAIGGVALGGWWREHYFIQAVAPLAFLAGAGLARLGTAPRRTVWAAALAGALIFFVGRDGRLALRPPGQASWELYHRPGYLLQADVSRYIASTTDETDTIYVAFAEAELYYLSGRRAAAPQLFQLDAERSQAVFDSIVGALAEGRPALVVVVQPPPPNRMSEAAFAALLDRRYRLERRFTIDDRSPALELYRRRAGS